MNTIILITYGVVLFIALQAVMLKWYTNFMFENAIVMQQEMLKALTEEDEDEFGEFNFNI